jgi:hypothetical protein
MKTDILKETTASTDILKIKKGLFRLRGSPGKCARVVGELISWALRPTRLTATIQVLICEQK